MDFEQISAALGLASSAVGLTGKAASTAEAIKKLVTSESAPDAGETAQLLNTLAGQLTAANMTNVELSEALKALSQELHRQDEFEKEKSRYELFQTNENDIVFRLKEGAANGQPIHFICPVCLNRDKLISYVSGSHYKTCQTDGKHGFKFEKTPPPRRVRMRDF